jgi:hypothetical protein
MTADLLCPRTQAELSSLRDVEGTLSPAATAHLEECDRCSRFAAAITGLDDQLGRGRFELAPDVSGQVIRRLGASPRRWWSVAAAALVGLVAGALIGGVGTNLETVRAGDLGELFRVAGPAVDTLAAEVLVVERGWHPEVEERIYVGSIAYAAPEEIEISLVDTTSYPGGEWLPNDVLVRYGDGDFLSVASAPCPVAALPACQRSPFANGTDGLRPFDDGVISPLAIVGPGRVLNRWGGLEVIGAPVLSGRPTIQIETSYAAADQVRALTRHGAWREFHPSDRVVIWLDEETLLPLRTEVYAADSPERELWALRRGYRDEGEAPILVVELTVSSEPAPTPPDLPPDAAFAGFVEGPVEMALPELSPDLAPYRTGTWRLPDGAPVEVASWSDGRTWVRIESTAGWEEPRLFGIPGVFVERVELRPGSVGYLSPDGSAVAIHGEGVDVVVTGTLPVHELRAAAASLSVDGVRVPDQWEQAGVVDAGSLPDDVLVPEAEGWSVLGMADGDRTTLLLTGAGQRSVLGTQEPGERLDPPDGPDFVVVDVAGITGRFDASSQKLEWVEDGRVIALRSETVGLAELIDLARSMRR